MWGRGNKSRKGKRNRRLGLEALESRDVPTALADLVAYRPVTEYINYAQYPVAEINETDPKLGPGIRYNGDDDNANGQPDVLDAVAGAAENDLIRVDVTTAGDSFSLNWSDELRVWTTNTKTEAVVEGALYSPGQRTWWVEYVGAAHSTGATLSIVSTEGAATAQDDVVFHSFQSDVIAIGGNSQNPANVGDPRLGIFTVGVSLYQQGYDVHLYSYDKVNSAGKGAAFDEVKSAVLKRNVDSVAILGYSWGGGSLYLLSTALKADASLTGQFQLQYTAYVDGVKRNSVSAETRKPVNSLYHDNIYQRKDVFVKGNSVAGAVNLNVTTTTWGKSLMHTAIDDNGMVQTILITNLKSRLLA